MPYFHATIFADDYVARALSILASIACTKSCHHSTVNAPFEWYCILNRCSHCVWARCGHCCWFRLVVNVAGQWSNGFGYIVDPFFDRSPCW